MKKILFVTAFTPSKFSAGQNFTINLLDDISREYQVDLIYFRYKDQEYVPSHPNIQLIRSVGLTIINRIINCVQFPFFHPFFSFRFNYSTLRSLRKLSAQNNYHAVYLDFSQVFIYGFFLDHPNKILMAHDVIDQKFQREGSWLMQRWVRWTENILLKRGRILTFSQKDQQWIQKTYGKPSEVVNFYLSPQIMALQNELVVPEDYFCFYGAWNRPENYEGLQWFMSEILPHTGAARFLVLGASMPDDLAQVISQEKNIRYLGFVDNPYETIARAKALIAPLFKGAGVKVKVVESLACGTPVIGTAIALEGVTIKNTRYTMECHTAGDFVHEIVNFGIDARDKMELRQSFIDEYTKRSKTIEL